MPNFDIGAYTSKSTVTPPIPPVPELDVYVKLKIGGKLKNVKVTRRKTDSGVDALLTINKSTVLKVE